MAVTSQAIPAAELAARAAEATALVGRNLCEIAYKQAVAQFVTNKTGTLAAGDISASGYDRRRLTQRRKDRLWRGASSGTSWYLVIDTGTDLQWTDCLVVGAGHNLSGVNCTVEADSSTPAVPWVGATTVVASFALAAGVNVKLHAATMYKARYWRITLSSGGAFTPEGVSFWLGKSIQFPVAPLFTSSTPNSYAADFAENKTTGGIPHRTIFHGALMERSLTWMIDQNHVGTFFSDTGYGFDDFFSNSNSLYGGAQSFWLIDQPTAAPNSAKLVRLQSPRVSPLLKRGGSSSSGATLLSLEVAEVGG